MRLYIPDLKKEQGKFIPFNGSVKLMFNDDKFVVMDVRLQAAYIPNRVLLKGQWQVNVEGECSRCLEKFVYCLKDDFYEEFIHLKGPAEQKGFEELELENGERFAFKGESIDLTEYLRQSFLMSQPLKILCRDDCKGLCPICGINKNKEECQCTQENINSCWAALEKIRRGL